MLEPRIGTTVFGRYLLEKELAKGAMGSVWVGEDKRLERKVAIKTLKANWADSKDAKGRFEREAMAVAKLNSPYIVQIFDYGIDNGCPFIVMELMEGEDLDARLKRNKRIGIWELIPIVVQTAKALTVAHQAGIVHRDLKPGNLFLVQSEDDEIVKVLDFGVAKATQQDDDMEQEATKAGTLLGTPVFMSPEQARGVKGLDHRADLWSLGVIIFRALTGKLPFVGSSVTDTVVKICTAPPPRATKIAPDLPAEVDTFFTRALARNPTARFKSARELASAFARIAPRPSYPSMTLPGLPHDVQQEIFESSLSQSGAAYQSQPQPNLTASVVAAEDERTEEDVTKKNRRGPRQAVVDVGAGAGVGGLGQAAPFAPAPSARAPSVGLKLRSEAVTLRPQARRSDDDEDDDEDDDLVTSLYQGARGKDGKFSLAAAAGIEDEKTRERASALPGLVEDETTTDRASGASQPGSADSQPGAEVTPPPLPGTAIVDVDGSMEPVAPLSTDGAPISSGGLFDTGSAELRQSHGTLGSQAQALDSPSQISVPKKSGRTGVIVGAAAAAVVLIGGALVLLSTGSDDAAATAGSTATSVQAATADGPDVPTDEPPAPPPATAVPSAVPSTEPTTEPSAEPTAEPSAEPTAEPVATPTEPKPPVTVAQPRPPRPPPPPPKPPPKPPEPPPEEDTYGSRY